MIKVMWVEETLGNTQNWYFIFLNIEITNTKARKSNGESKNQSIIRSSSHRMTSARVNFTKELYNLVNKICL